MLYLLLCCFLVHNTILMQYLELDFLVFISRLPPVAGADVALENN